MPNLKKTLLADLRIAEYPQELWRALFGLPVYEVWEDGDLFYGRNEIRAVTIGKLAFNKTEFLSKVLMIDDIHTIRRVHLKHLKDGTKEDFYAILNTLVLDRFIIFPEDCCRFSYYLESLNKKLPSFRLANPLSKEKDQGARITGRACKYSIHHYKNIGKKIFFCLQKYDIEMALDEIDAVKMINPADGITPITVVELLYVFRNWHVLRGNVVFVNAAGDAPAVAGPPWEEPALAYRFIRYLENRVNKYLDHCWTEIAGKNEVLLSLGYFILYMHLLLLKKDFQYIPLINRIEDMAIVSGLCKNNEQLRSFFGLYCHKPKSDIPHLQALLREMRVLQSHNDRISCLKSWSLGLGYGDFNVPPALKLESRDWKTFSYINCIHCGRSIALEGRGCHCRVCGYGYYCSKCAPEQHVVDRTGRIFYEHVCVRCLDRYRNYIPRGYY